MNDSQAMSAWSERGLQPSQPSYSMPGTLVASGFGLSIAAQGSANAAVSAPAPAPAISEKQAARFLFQASMGASREQIAAVRKLGYAAWIEQQFAMPASLSRWDWLVSKGFNAITFKNSEAGFDAATWRKMMTSPDTLRQRVTLALSEITVAAISGLVGGGWRAFSAAAYLDLLEANAFGNYRTLLQQISVSAPMGQYLTYRGNVKANPITGAMPDENYAREVMQLFSIGLIKLNLDGTPLLQGGKAQDTYGLSDITGLARVFTGWNFDMAGRNNATPDFLRRPMIQIPSRHETGAASFLGATVPAGGTGLSRLTMALDIIFSHPNVAPFISRQLIQRLVTSNPSPAYVARVAAIFNNDGKGVKGNLKAVIKALLLDVEARNDNSSASQANNPAAGKLREPVLRLCAWARAFKANSPSDTWAIGNTSNPSTRLGQSPGRSPTVFNFFRPGYVPPNSKIAAAALVAPEFQIINESTVTGYVNYMQNAVSRGIGDVAADYSSLLPLADNAQALLDELNLVLAAGQLSGATINLMRGALDGMSRGSDANRRNRIYAALVMVLAAPEFIVQK